MMAVAVCFCTGERALTLDFQGLGASFLHFLPLVLCFGGVAEIGESVFLLGPFHTTLTRASLASPLCSNTPHVPFYEDPFVFVVRCPPAGAPVSLEPLDPRCVVCLCCRLVEPEAYAAFPPTLRCMLSCHLCERFVLANPKPRIFPVVYGCLY